MCTLSFIPKTTGYLVAMNRDERLLRQRALPPQISDCESLQAVYPREPGGGTWIGSNNAGITFALLNRNSGLLKKPKLRSRGEIIPRVLACKDLSQARSSMAAVDPCGMLPFRLVAFFPGERTILQWSWDNDALQAMRLGWRTHHWFSSGISDELAREARSRTFRDAWRHRSAGSAEWLRGLHASHAPARGSFSVCVHRPDAASVSYTEIDYQAPGLTMRYHTGYPCQALGQFDMETTLRPRFPNLAAAS
jgi:transport and Golgi organization protein 2